MWTVGGDKEDCFIFIHLLLKMTRIHKINFFLKHCIIISHVHDVFKTCNSFAECWNLKASIFPNPCMDEHQNWARTSPAGTDSDSIWAWRQASSAYLYNTSFGRGLGWGSKGRKGIARSRVRRSLITTQQLLRWSRTNQQVVSYTIFFNWFF